LDALNKPSLQYTALTTDITDFSNAISVTTDAISGSAVAISGSSSAICGSVFRSLFDQSKPQKPALISDFATENSK
jgi:hypothetical protein